MTATNREIFTNAFADFAAGKIDVLHQVLREDFVEHSPGNPSGRDAFIAYLAESPVATAQLTLHRVIAGDDYVVAHYRLVEEAHGLDMAVVDIWRFEDGLIVEHWDVMQPMPDPAEVPNGMF